MDFNAFRHTFFLILAWTRAQAGGLENRGTKQKVYVPAVLGFYGARRGGKNRKKTKNAHFLLNHRGQNMHSRNLLES